MERDNDISGQGNNLDFGARIYDSRLGRWLSVDPLQKKYPDISPMAYAGNTPISAYDPDGEVVIFINGFYGPPTLACCPASAKHWGEDWVKGAKNQIGDQKDLFFDGSMGGLSGVLHGDGVNENSSLNWRVRKAEGYKAGQHNAKSIIDNLAEGETIKFVTSSMGSAFQRGFSQALIDYKNSHNLEVLSHNNLAMDYNKMLAKYKKDNPNDKAIQAMKEMTLRDDWLTFEIEMVIDLDPMQGDEIGKDKNATSNFFALNTKSISDYDDFQVFETVVGSPVEGSTEIGTGQMIGHHPASLPAVELPESRDKPKEGEKKKE